MNSAPAWELSGWWRRVGASIIDSIIVGVASAALAAIVLLLTGVEVLNASDELSGAFVLSVVIAAYLAVPAIYYCSIMTSTNGQTVGKQALDIRVVREDGLAVDAWWAFKRQILVINLLFGLILGFFLFGLPQLIDYLWPLWDAKNQALHDKIVKSRVVRATQVVPDPYGVQPPQPYFTPDDQAPPPPPPPPPQQPGQPYYGPLSPQGQQQAQQPPFPQGSPAPPAPPSAPPPPPPPGGASTAYTPPPGFDNPVPDDDNN